MNKYRLLILAALAVMLGVVPAQAHGNEIHTFQFASQGCAGGGDVCGSFPLVPGDATYGHHAASNGAVSVQAAAEGLAPACTPVTCRPSQLRFHGEAVAGVWADVDTPDGLSSLSLAATYSVGEVEAVATPLLGHADASASVVVAAVPAPGSSPACSDGSNVVGTQSVSVTASGSLDAKIACAGGGTLTASTWRVSITARASATADSGEAEAEAEAHLHSIAVQFQN